MNPLSDLLTNLWSDEVLVCGGHSTLWLFSTVFVGFAARSCFCIFPSCFFFFFSFSFFPNIRFPACITCLFWGSGEYSDYWEFRILDMQLNPWCRCLTCQFCSPLTVVSHSSVFALWQDGYSDISYQSSYMLLMCSPVSGSANWTPPATFFWSIVLVLWWTWMFYKNSCTGSDKGFVKSSTCLQQHLWACC